MVNTAEMPSTYQVLIVDDNEQQLRLFKYYALTLPEAEYVPAQTLEDAIEHIAIDPPDLVLLDNRLHPYADYRQTVPEIRAAGYCGNIVVMSADTVDPVFADINAFDVVGLIDKSEFSLKSYRHLISRYLS